MKSTTGKSIESIIVKSRRAWLASALSVVLLVAWRLAGMLLDLVLLVVIVAALAVYAHRSFKRKA
ncbi:hypothetical protein [Klebsiella electrica]|uniref:hypothetical protein n=1 Tax=Klebsiella electrica TaxID=1259973 RepID=UPI0011544DA6|nr:hypothetical protein [Klebsiella electrica]